MEREKQGDAICGAVIELLAHSQFEGERFLAGFILSPAEGLGMTI